MVEVLLGGVGTQAEPPPSTTIADILDFFDASVADGTLVGNGPGKSANGRKNALRNMIEAAGDLIDDYYVEEACQQLLDAYLAQMILDLMASLGCE